MIGAEARSSGVERASMRAALWTVCSITTTLVTSCSSEPERHDGGIAGDAGDAGARDGAEGDGGARDAEATDRGPSDAGPGPYGFIVRTPEEHQLSCPSCPNGTITALDVDYVCTLRWRTWDHVIYVQASPESFGGFGVSFIYRVAGAFISDGQTVQPITAVYDWGGNHHNDAINLDLPEQFFRYWHSSFGFGYRQCQPMDCLEVREPHNGAVIEDGCTRDRTVPITCVLVAPDGTVPPLVDQFMRCPGDT